MPHEQQRFNGKTGEFVRWGLGLALAAPVSYFTAQAKTDAQVAELRERQINNFSEILRRLDVMQADIREMRSR